MEIDILLTRSVKNDSDSLQSDPSALHSCVISASQPRISILLFAWVERQSKAAAAAAAAAMVA